MPDPKDDPTQAEFWEREEEEITEILKENGIPIYEHGYEGALDQLAALDVSFPELGIAVDVAALDFADTWATGVGKQVTGTSQVFLQGAFVDWIDSGEPLSDLITTVQGSGMFSANRAEMIAITEVTRIYAESNIEAWKDTGVVMGMRWMTVNDNLVCPICDPLNGKITNLVGGQFVSVVALPSGGTEEIISQSPPSHVRCRCFLQPVVNEGITGAPSNETPSSAVPDILEVPNVTT